MACALCGCWAVVNGFRMTMISRARFRFRDRVQALIRA